MHKFNPTVNKIFSVFVKKFYYNPKYFNIGLCNGNALCPQIFIRKMVKNSEPTQGYKSMNYIPWLMKVFYDIRAIAYLFMDAMHEVILIEKIIAFEQSKIY